MTSLDHVTKLYNKGRISVECLTGIVLVLEHCLDDLRLQMLMLCSESSKSHLACLRRTFISFFISVSSSYLLRAALSITSRALETPPSNEITEFHYILRLPFFLS